MQVPTEITIYLSAVLFLLGACVASFVTCMADRYVAPKRQKRNDWVAGTKPQSFKMGTRELLFGRSKCDTCGSTLGVLDLVPIFSYIFLGGRCRKCGAKIPARCLMAELTGGLAYAAIFLKFGYSFVTLEYLLLFPALLGLSLVDLDIMEIPDGLLIYMGVVFLVFLYPHGGYLARAKEALIASLAFGGGLLLISLLLDRILGRETLGGGDIKLIYILAHFTGVWCGLLTIFCSCIFGLLTVLTGGRRKKNKEFPFGPSIAAAGGLALLFGQELVDLYLSLIL